MLGDKKVKDKTKTIICMLLSSGLTTGGFYSLFPKEIEQKWEDTKPSFLTKEKDLISPIDTIENQSQLLRYLKNNEIVNSFKKGNCLKEKADNVESWKIKDLPVFRVEEVGKKEILVLTEKLFTLDNDII